MCRLLKFTKSPNRNAGDVEMRQLTFVNMLKDLALAAFAIYVAVNAKHQRLNTDVQAHYVEYLRRMGIH